MIIDMKKLDNVLKEQESILKSFDHLDVSLRSEDFGNEVKRSQIHVDRFDNDNGDVVYWAAVLTNGTNEGYFISVEFHQSMMNRAVAFSIRIHASNVDDVYALLRKVNEHLQRTPIPYYIG